MKDHLAFLAVKTLTDEAAPEEFADDVLAELKTLMQQIMKLMKQLLPEDEVAQVVAT